MASRSARSRPIVSVVVPVFNVEPYLRECLDSVIAQTFGFERIQLIAVDDGSTDGSGRILDEYARTRGVTVIHEPRSGGAGRPRNVGLDIAIGTYVFFLDADDYLGTEALERLVDSAERNRSDIVIGKMVPIGGRRLRTIAFQKRSDRADLERVYLSGNVLKLFRRSLIEGLGLRFQEGISRLEDGAFMARIYPAARRVSVVNEYDCYYVRQRPRSRPGSGLTHDLAGDIARLESHQMAVVGQHRRRGPTRDMLMAKHIERLARLFDRPWLSLDGSERRETFELAASVVSRWHTSLIGRVLPAWAAIRIHCLQHGLRSELEDIVATPLRTAFGDPIVERRRVFARYPHFRDASGIPDRCFDITHRVVPVHRLTMAVIQDDTIRIAGEAYLTLVGGVTAVRVKRWPRGLASTYETKAIATPDLRDYLVRHPTAGFEVAIAVASLRPHLLRPGICSLELTIGTEAIHRTVPIRVPESIAATPGFQASSAYRAVAFEVTGASHLRLRIGRPSRVISALETFDRSWSWLSRNAVKTLVRILTSNRPGRMIELALEELRPGLAARILQE
jgi:poly(ribitol-phosphate) beta-N-acetylglucosaminyltransferase